MKIVVSRKKVTIMDKEIASKLNVLINDKVMKRKAMFLPLFAISAFGVVGYAAADREAQKFYQIKYKSYMGQIFLQKILKSQITEINQKI